MNPHVVLKKIQKWSGKCDAEIYLQEHNATSVKKVRRKNGDELENSINQHLRRQMQSVIQMDSGQLKRQLHYGLHLF